jgi:hypothetical protein
MAQISVVNRMEDRDLERRKLSAPSAIYTFMELPRNSHVKPHQDLLANPMPPRRTLATRKFVHTEH